MAARVTFATEPPSPLDDALRQKSVGAALFACDGTADSRRFDGAVDSERSEDISARNSLSMMASSKNLSAGDMAQAAKRMQAIQRGRIARREYAHALKLSHAEMRRPYVFGRHRSHRKDGFEDKSMVKEHPRRSSRLLEEPSSPGPVKWPVGSGSALMNPIQADAVNTIQAALKRRQLLLRSAVLNQLPTPTKLPAPRPPPEPGRTGWTRRPDGVIQPQRGKNTFSGPPGSKRIDSPPRVLRPQRRRQAGCSPFGRCCTVFVCCAAISGAVAAALVAKSSTDSDSPPDLPPRPPLHPSPASSPPPSPAAPLGILMLSTYDVGAAVVNLSTHDAAHLNASALYDALDDTLTRSYHASPSTIIRQRALLPVTFYQPSTTTEAVLSAVRDAVCGDRPAAECFISASPGSSQPPVASSRQLAGSSPQPAPRQLAGRLSFGVSAKLRVTRSFTRLVPRPLTCHSPCSAGKRTPRAPTLAPAAARRRARPASPQPYRPRQHPGHRHR